MNVLETIRDADIPTRTLKGYSSKCKVVRVVDGDTVYLVCFEPDSDRLMKLNCRLNGIDTPEMKKTPDIAKAARQELIKLVCNTMNENDNTKIMWVKFYGPDKYGRELVDLFESEGMAESVNARLISMGIARKYDGGAKASW